MFSALFSTFLLFIPGVMAAELNFFLKANHQRKCVDLALLSFIYAWIILFSNVLVKTLLGGGEEVFMITNTQFQTISLLKYLGLSLVFALLYPNILIMLELILKKGQKKSHDKP